jgi:hypothetical protein
VYREVVVLVGGAVVLVVPAEPVVPAAVVLAPVAPEPVVLVLVAPVPRLVVSGLDGAVGGTVAGVVVVGPDDGVGGAGEVGGVTVVVLEVGGWVVVVGEGATAVVVVVDVPLTAGAVVEVVEEVTVAVVVSACDVVDVAVDEVVSADARPAPEPPHSNRGTASTVNAPAKVALKAGSPRFGRCEEKDIRAPTFLLKRVGKQGPAGRPDHSADGAPPPRGKQVSGSFQRNRKAGDAAGREPDGREPGRLPAVWPLTTRPTTSSRPGEVVGVRG